MSASPSDVLAGLNGWYRWANWAAHFFVDGKQLCNTHHGRFVGSERTARRPDSVELSARGVPFGTVCSRCRKLAAERHRYDPWKLLEQVAERLYDGADPAKVAADIGRALDGRNR